MLKLYRGVNKGNKTMPELYYSDGLLTKQVDSRDDPEPHKKYGWLKTIASHIDYKTSPQKRFIYDTTQYLSFSSELNVALNFIGGPKNLPFGPSARQDAGAYLFTLTLDENNLQEVEPGAYHYTYSCNYGKTNTDPKFTGLIAGLYRCNICTPYPGYQHKLLVLDAERFLRDKQADYADEYQKAAWDREWLVMPADPMMDHIGRGFQSRIVISDIWDVDFYKYTT